MVNTCGSILPGTAAFHSSCDAHLFQPPYTFISPPVFIQIWSVFAHFFFVFNLVYILLIFTLPSMFIPSDMYLYVFFLDVFFVVYTFIHSSFKFYSLSLFYFINTEAMRTPNIPLPWSATDRLFQFSAASVCLHDT